MTPQLCMLSYPSVYTRNLGALFLFPEKNPEICPPPFLHQGYWWALSLRRNPTLRRGRDSPSHRNSFIQILTWESANKTNLQVTEENYFLIDRSTDTPRPPCMLTCLSQTCAFNAISLPWRASSYFIISIFQKFPFSTECGCMPEKTEMCKWTALTRDLINTELPCDTQLG